MQRDEDNALALARRASRALKVPVIWPRPGSEDGEAIDPPNFAPPQVWTQLSAIEVADACRHDERKAVEEAARAAATAAFGHRALHAGGDDEGGGGDPVRIVLVQLRGGVVNQTCRATRNTTISGGSATSIIVRLRGAGDGIASPMHEYIKEAWCAKCAVAAGLPAARPVGLGVVACHPEIPERVYAFFVQEFVDGVVADQVVRDGLVSDIEIWRQLGAFAGGTHSIPVSGFGDCVSLFTIGEVDELRPISFSANTFDRYIGFNISMLRKGPSGDVLQARGLLPPSKSQLCISLLRSLRERAIAGEFKFGLCHGDLSLRNVLVASDDPSRVTGVVDRGCAEAAIVPHSSLVMLTEWSMYGSPLNEVCTGAFACAAGVSGSALVALMPDVRAMLLLRAMAKTRWAVDHSSEEIESMAEHLVACIEMVETVDGARSARNAI